MDPFLQRHLLQTIYTLYKPDGEALKAEVLAAFGYEGAEYLRELNLKGLIRQGSESTKIVLTPRGKQMRRSSIAP